MKAFQITYDADANSLYVYLPNHKGLVAVTRQVVDGQMMVDFTEDGELAGVEILLFKEPA